MKNKIKDYLIILVFTIIISIPLFNENFNIYIDDGVQHIARLMGTYQTITEKQVPPVIMSNFCNGFGYSWNIFYSPLTAYLPLIFRVFTSSFELMLKLFMTLVSFLSGIAMYEFIKKVTKNKYAGILGAILYILAPYRLTDMYMRIAISELASFIFIPIVFHGMYNIFNCKEKNIKKSLVLTLGAVGLILTHTVIAMYIAIFCMVYVIINIRKLKEKEVLKMLVINILLILLLTSFYLLPMLEHKLATDYEVFEPGRMERTEVLKALKVDVTDLLYTPQGNFSFEIGLVSLIGIVFTLLTYKKIDKEIREMYWFALVLGFICIIFSLRFFPYENMPAILKMIQFTFRLLEFSSFFFIFVAAINYSLVIKNFKMKDVIIISIIAFLLVVPLKKNLDFEKNYSEDRLWPAVEVNDNTGRVHAGCATFEYLPSKAFDNLDYIKHREDRVYVLSGNAVVKNEEKNGTNMKFSVSNIEESTIIELPYIFYLGYNVEITNEAGETLKIDTFESDNGFVAIKIDREEEGTVSVKYTGTNLMKISYTISFVTFISLVLIFILNKYWNYITSKRK